MIKFFRKIRRNLLMENKTGTYFKYAIGEIVLVVIGILIAISINNWNETNKNEREQIVFLNNLKNDLKNDLIQLDQILKLQKEKLSTVNELKDQLLYERYYYRLIYNGELYDKKLNEVSSSQGKFFNTLTLKLNSKDVIEDSDFVNLITIVFLENSTYVKKGDRTKSEILKVLKLVEQRLND